MAVSSDIEVKANTIRSAVKGKDVRESLASGIEDIDLVAEDTKSRQDTVEADFKSIQQSEAARITNEQIRQSNENTRINSESTRITAETVRETAEVIRETNETAREKIINNFKSFGEHDPNTTYNQYNTVTYQGSTYMCLADKTKGTLPTDTSKWLCLAQKGQDGIGGDMFKSTYDTTNNGIVDNAEKLGGHDASHYALANDLSDLNQTVTLNETDLTVYSTVKSGLDVNGIYTEVDLKRQDGTLIVKSILNGTSPNYTTRTETWYKADGVTVNKTVSYVLTYDANNNVEKEVIS